MRRREFLKASLGAAGSSLLFQTGCTSLDHVFGADAGFYDQQVLIVGAGLAGLAAAQELKRSRVSYHVIEKASRIGGRVRTVTSMNADHQFAEVGAEFVDARHTTVFEICSQLSLPLEAVEDNSTASSFWFKEHLFLRKNLAKSLQPILSKLIRERLNLVDQEEKFAQAFNLKTATRRAIELDQLSFEDLLMKISARSPSPVEDYLRLAAQAQFGIEANRQSSLHFLMALDMGAQSTGTYRIRGGTERLVRGLYDHVAGVLPDFFIRLESTLLSVKSLEKGFECRIRGPEGVRTIRTAAILFAVPPAALRKIDGLADLPLGSNLKNAIQSWSMASQSKAVLSFSERFWNFKGDGPGGLALLGDFPSQNIWDSSRGQPGKSGLATVSVSGMEGAQLGAGATSQALIDLGLIWKKLPTNTFDHSAFVHNWTQQPGLEGSQTVFEPGQMTKLNGAFEDLRKDSKIAFAGEHTSSTQFATMEGALNTGRAAAARLVKALKG